MFEKKRELIKVKKWIIKYKNLSVKCGFWLEIYSKGVLLIT